MECDRLFAWLILLWRFIPALAVSIFVYVLIGLILVV